MNSEFTTDQTENASVSFRKSTLKRIKEFMDKNKILKFSPTIDTIVNKWLNEQESKKEEDTSKA